MSVLCLIRDFNGCSAYGSCFISVLIDGVAKTKKRGPHVFLDWINANLTLPKSSLSNAVVNKYSPAKFCAGNAIDLDSGRAG